MNTTKAINILESNGFEVTGNGNGLFNVVSRATGATIARVVDTDYLSTLATGVEYAIHKDVDGAWKRPVRETGWYIVR